MPGHSAGTGPAKHLRQPDPLQMFPVGALLPELVTVAVQRRLPADQPSRLYVSQRLRCLQSTAVHVSQLRYHTQLSPRGMLCTRSRQRPATMYTYGRRLVALFAAGQRLLAAARNVAVAV